MCVRGFREKKKCATFCSERFVLRQGGSQAVGRTTHQREIGEKVTVFLGVYGRKSAAAGCICVISNRKKCAVRRRWCEEFLSLFEPLISLAFVHPVGLSSHAASYLDCLLESKPVQPMVDRRTLADSEGYCGEAERLATSEIGPGIEILLALFRHTKDMSR